MAHQCINFTGKKRKLSLDGKAVVMDQFVTLVTVEDKYVKSFFPPEKDESAAAEATTKPLTAAAIATATAAATTTAAAVTAVPSE